MVVRTYGTGFDPPGEAFEKGKDILIPWPVDSRRPKDENGKFMSMGKNRFFPHAFAPAIKGNRFTGASFLLHLSDLALPLPASIDEFLKMRIISRCWSDFRPCRLLQNRFPLTLGRPAKWNTQSHLFASLKTYHCNRQERIRQEDLSATSHHWSFEGDRTCTPFE
jgi:hypothetical protein